MDQLIFLVSYGSGLWIAALVAIFSALRWFFVPADRKRAELLLIASIYLQGATYFSNWAADSLSNLRPLKYDLYVYRFDSIFGEPSFRLGQIVLPNHWLCALMQVTYTSLTAAMLGTFAVYLWLRPKREVIRVARTFVLSVFLAVGIYLLFPVCGPEFAFPQFPQLPSAHLTPHLILINAAPNGVPSVHTSTALLVLWFLRPWRWGRFVGTIFLALTVLATKSGGQHYFFDLLCAVPYTVGIVWLDQRLESWLTARPATAYLVQTE